MMEISTSQRISTRQKSCVACVKAKRRCDLQAPYCTRCQARGLICNYSGVNRTATFETVSFQLPLPPLSFKTAFEVPSHAYPNPLTPIYSFDDLHSTSLVPSREVHLSKDRLDACVQHFRACIASFVQNGQTAFISPQLNRNDLPPILHDAYLLCVAYVNKTPQNESMVFAILTSKVKELLTKHHTCAIESELASVQALIIYQIIRLFDGDIRQRGIAESQFDILNTWAMHLHQQSECQFPSSFSASPYQKWIFIESVRRTALMALFLQGVYHAIKEGFCDKVPDMSGLPITVRGELWEAKTEVEWMLATRGTQPDVMTYHDFVGVWDGCPAGYDLEEFQKVLLIACIGEDVLQARVLDSLTRNLNWTQGSSSIST